MIPFTIDFIANLIFKEFNTTKEQVFDGTNKRAASDMRRLIYHMCSIVIYNNGADKRNKGVSAMAKYAGLEHSTVFVAIRSARQLLLTDKNFIALHNRCYRLIMDNQDAMRIQFLQEERNKYVNLIQQIDEELKSKTKSEAF